MTKPTVITDLSQIFGITGGAKLFDGARQEYLFGANNPG